MFWGCFAASSSECPESVQGRMKSQDHQAPPKHQEALFQSQVMVPRTG